MRNKNSNIEYEVLSPDGFSINFEKPFFNSKKEVNIALKEFVEKYKIQGYYSSRDFGRIPINEIKNYCKINKLIKN